MHPLTRPAFVQGLPQLFNRVEGVSKNLTYATSTLDIDTSFATHIISINSGINITGVNITLPAGFDNTKEAGFKLLLARQNVTNTFSWGSAPIYWPGNIPPVLTSVNNHFDVFTFIIPQGSPMQILGFVSGQDFNVSFV